MKPRATLILFGFALIIPCAVAQTNTFPSSGNVGVGTVSPGSRKLNVQSSDPTNDVGAEVANSRTTGTNYGLIATATGVGAGLNQGILATASGATQNFGIRIYNVTAAASNFALYSDSPAASYFQGNVGIGTTAPLRHLEVWGGATNASLAITNAGGAAYLLMGNQDSAGVHKPSIICAANGGLYFGNGTDWQSNVGGSTTNGMFVSGSGGVSIGSYAVNSNDAGVGNLIVSGYVGIGTTSPQQRLHVGGSASRLLFDSYTNVERVLLFGDGTGLNDYGFGIDSTDLVANFGAGGGMTFKSSAFNGPPIMRITGSGNVGIGTTNPTQKLSVNGTVQAKEVIVQTGWSDYVFDSDYHLAPLSEVEQHIKADKHLPGIPSAKQVAEQGISLGEMQAKLLAKLEEVTLHLISQEKEIKQLKRENAVLRGKMTVIEETR